MSMKQQKETGHKPPKILIADDEAFMRLLIKQALEDLKNQNVEILTAVNGEEALEIIRTERPALVFLDVMMPKVDGYEVCREVKRVLGMEDVFIVLLTARGQKDDRENGGRMGADIFMTKPFDPDEIISVVEKILGT